MKKIFLIAALALSTMLILDGCSPKTTTGTVAAKRGNVSGNWVLTNITFERIPEIAVKSFCECLSRFLKEYVSCIAKRK